VKVEVGAGGVSVSDLGSRHGSWLSGEPLGKESVPATAGDVLRVGDTLLLVVDAIERHAVAPRRINGEALGLPADAVAGPKMSAVWDYAARVASLPTPVLILGETGTGKEAVARLIHRAGGADRPFVALNVAAVADSLFESEVFGHERGAFTGAIRPRLGAFREAAGGVLFLDEVGDLPMPLQAKLLRAIDQNVVRPLGADRDVASDVRIVAATSQALEGACAEGRFRADLFHRLRGLMVELPPLRERPDEIVLISLSMLRDAGAPLSLSADVAERLSLGVWDGNVRALRYVLTHAMVAAGQAKRTHVLLKDLPPFELRVTARSSLSERDVRTAMLKAGGIASKAADSLGVSRTTFYNACKRLGIAVESLRVN
jgi:two-component system response regulator HydG